MLCASFGAAIISALLVYGGIAPPFAERPAGEDDYGAAEFAFVQAAFSEMPGWREDDQAEALPPFLLSCEAMSGRGPADPANPQEALGDAFTDVTLSGTIADWRPACAAAARVAARDYPSPDAAAAAARLFFENHFRPLKIVTVREPSPKAAALGRRPVVEGEGLFTGYFEPAYLASARQTPEFSAPIYARPNDLVMVDLGQFREELAGQRIAGSLRGGNLVPYPDHKDINGGALGPRARIIAWMDPDDLFFLQIQGSGRLRVLGRGEIRVGYDGQNGHPYTAIGRFLIERGEMALEDVSMQSIRDWLGKATPEEARALREANASYVFFRVLENLPDSRLGPLGASGAQLTPERSLAVDRRFHALGAPVWIALDDGRNGATGFRRLMIAQDTGGAIRGPVRGDIFFGAGPEAARDAGAMRATGEMIVLVPTPAADRLIASSVRIS